VGCARQVVNDWGKAPAKPFESKVDWFNWSKFKEEMFKNIKRCLSEE